ncbi:protein ddi1 2-like protein, partial [Nannochloropsis gaditana CCMP526]|uniref:protein ddi1 2-like protein n=1 Tax=Nannochloropsis gaditana (strain CCMP526) TaxID=1093141 RepID=UPI00029F5BED
MAAITLTVADEEGNAASLQDTVEALKALVEIEMRVPSAQQVLLKDGAPLAPGARLGALGVADNDFLFLVRDNSNANISGMSGRDTSTSSATTATATASADAGTGRVGPASAVHSLKDLPAGLGPEQLMTTIKANGRLLAELQHHNAPLAAAIATGDVVKVRSVQMKQKLEAVSRRVEEQEAIRALEANPMDPEAQRKIESMIQRENVHRNMELAMEEMPEAFGSVVMLYVDVHVNGHPIKAFVDSGAQSTIMSAACALRCGLSRLIDTRFAGIAKGVGTSKILGRIHMHTLKVGESPLSPLHGL